MQRKAILLVAILSVPLLSGAFAPSYGTVSAAIDDCQGDLSPIVWNETISRHAEVPHNNNWWDSFFDDDWDDDGRGKNAPPPGEESSTEPQDPALSPEEPWMYQNYHSNTPVERLTTNLATSMLIGNDSVGTLRVNLSSAHRTTICVEIQGLVGDTTVPAKADVYLMTTSQYDRYTQAYDIAHGAWGLKEHRDDDKDYHPLEDREFVKKLVGLRTNASNVPQNKWLKWMYEGKVSDWAWQRRNKCSGE